MRCHGYKGGTGTSSRIVPGVERDYTLGVLVQANHGQKQDLRIGNVPVGEILAREEAGAGEQVKLPAAGRAAEGSTYPGATKKSFILIYVHPGIIILVA